MIHESAYDFLIQVSGIGGDVGGFLLVVDMEYWSVALVLDDAVADGESEEGLAVLIDMRLGVRWTMLGHLADLMLLLGGFESRELLRLFNLFEVQKFVHGRLPNRDHLLDHVPEDALREWCSRQRSLVRPSAVVVEHFYKLGQVQLGSASRMLFVDNLIQKLVVEVVKTVPKEVLFIHDFEEEAEHAV